MDDLLPARYYRFRIIAVNSVGESDASDPSPIQEPLKMPSQRKLLRLIKFAAVNTFLELFSSHI